MPAFLPFFLPFLPLKALTSQQCSCKMPRFNHIRFIQYSKAIKCSPIKHFWSFVSQWMFFKKDCFVFCFPLQNKIGNKPQNFTCFLEAPVFFIMILYARGGSSPQIHVSNCLSYKNSSRCQSLLSSCSLLSPSNPYGKWAISLLSLVSTLSFLSRTIIIHCFLVCFFVCFVLYSLIFLESLLVPYIIYIPFIYLEKF